jgi:hypothetical protein
MSRSLGISLRGDKHDIDHWSGYSYKSYRYIAMTIGDHGIKNIWDGEETGNFLPTNCCFVIVKKNQPASVTITQLWGQVKELI